MSSKLQQQKKDAPKERRSNLRSYQYIPEAMNWMGIILFHYTTVEYNFEACLWRDLLSITVGI